MLISQLKHSKHPALELLYASCRCRGSVLPRSLMFAVPSALLAVFLKFMEFEGFLPDGVDFDIMSNNAGFTGFSFAMGFLFVFRTSQSYSRFWEGVSLGHRMYAEWYDFASSVICFTRMSKQPDAVKLIFQHRFIRVLSLLHAAASAELRGIDGSRFEFIDLDGLDLDSVDKVKYFEHPVTLVSQWCMELVMEAVDGGVIAAPPPIVSRAYHEFANGMIAFHDAAKIQCTKFPFAYTQLTAVMLLAHWIITPIMMVQWIQQYLWVFVMTLVQVLFFWSLYFIAIEIEFPFQKGDLSEEFEAHERQIIFNKNLLVLIDSETHKLPLLCAEANVNIGELSNIHSTHSMKKVAEAANRNRAMGGRHRHPFRRQLGSFLTMRSGSRKWRSLIQSQSSSASPLQAQPSLVSSRRSAREKAYSSRISARGSSNESDESVVGMLSRVSPGVIPTTMVTTASIESHEEDIPHEDGGPMPRGRTFSVSYTVGEFDRSMSDSAIEVRRERTAMSHRHSLMSGSAPSPLPTRVSSPPVAASTPSVGNAYSMSLGSMGSCTVVGEASQPSPSRGVSVGSVGSQPLAVGDHLSWGGSSNSDNVACASDPLPTPVPKDEDGGQDHRGYSFQWPYRRRRSTRHGPHDDARGSSLSRTVRFHEQNSARSRSGALSLEGSAAMSGLTQQGGQVPLGGQPMQLQPLELHQVLQQQLLQLPRQYSTRSSAHNTPQRSTQATPQRSPRVSPGRGPVLKL